MPRVIHFEIHAEEPHRAIRFYSTVFGWKFKKWEGPRDYWLIQTVPKSSPGIDGGMIKREGPRGMGIQTYICTIDVPNIDDYLGKVMIANGLVINPKMPVTGVGWIAHCKDPEGNIFGIMQEDPAAK